MKSNRMCPALADCAKHHVAIPADQLKRKPSNWECPYCKLARVERLPVKWTSEAVAAGVGKPRDGEQAQRCATELLLALNQQEKSDDRQ